jgi:hypothetical protein
MADSYIYSLPQSTAPTLSDFTVVDTYVSAASGYITSRASLLTLARATSGTISQALTSQQPIAQWTTAFETTSSLSSYWVESTTVVQSYSSNWNDVVTTLASASGDWVNTTTASNALITDYQSNSSNWQSTFNTVSTLSSTWTNSPLDAYSLSTIETTALSATEEVILVTVGGQPRAIKLWQY